MTADRWFVEQRSLDFVFKHPKAIYVCTSMSILWNTWQEYSSPLLARPRRNWLRCAKVLSMQRIFLQGHKYFPHSNTASSFTCAPPPAPASSSEQPAWHLQPAFYFYYLIWTIAFFCIFTSPSFSSEHLKYKVETLTFLSNQLAVTE